MLKFEQERINIVNIDSVNFSNPIPAVCVKPKVENNNTVIFIYNGGIGSSIASSLYMNSFLYDCNYFITYEKAGHGNNKNKASQFKKNYILELDEIVLWVKKQFPGKKIYLLGESWGTAINFIYYRDNVGKIDGTIGWNMPFGITNPERKTAKQMYSIVWRELVTFIFNIECHLPAVQTSQEKFSRDPLFRRLLTIVPPSKTNTKINLCVWRFMKPTYRFICKFGRNSKYNFMYIQSGQDVMANWKFVKRIEKNVDNIHYLKFPTGYHVLSMEPKESIDLWKTVLDFVKK